MQFNTLNLKVTKATKALEDRKYRKKITNVYLKEYENRGKVEFPTLNDEMKLREYLKWLDELRFVKKASHLDLEAKRNLLHQFTLRKYQRGEQINHGQDTLVTFTLVLKGKVAIIYKMPKLEKVKP